MTKPPKPRLLFMHAEQSEEAARAAVEAYRADRRNVGRKWSCRVYLRHVRADGSTCPCWVVVVRERAK